MNFRQIEAFRAVCETGSMTAAGEALGIPQPAISRLIRDLVQQFDLQLFTRKGARISPTQDAIALQQEVERCFDGLEQVVKFANGLNRSRNEQLRIAAPVGQ
ncbi:MAG: LysR family transcriptional regulator, partial [Hyphomicrobiaceae bacterium]